MARMVSLPRSTTPRRLQNGGEPQVMRLTIAEADAFPRRGSDLKGAHPYLAVGLDLDGRGTYSLRHIYTPGAPLPFEMQSTSGSCRA